MSRPQKRRRRPKKGGSGNAVRAGRANGSKHLQHVQACLVQAVRQGDLIGVIFEGEDEPHFLPVEHLDETLAKPGLLLVMGNEAVTQYVIAKKSAPPERRLH